MLKDNEPLLALKAANKIIVEPIWENQIDDVEGPLYAKYILEHPEYNQIYVRESVASMLKEAAENLPDGYKLVIRAGHRPLEVQYSLLNGVKEQYKVKNPGASEGQALEFARTYVSDPSIKLPPHCCGAAVDVDMLDIKTGLLVDFGCPVNTDNEIAFLDNDKLNAVQQKNRKMLHEAMLSAGFAPFQYEWWHFSYGDQKWADYYRAKDILYGLIELLRH